MKRVEGRSGEGQGRVGRRMGQWGKRGVRLGRGGVGNEWRMGGGRRWEYGTVEVERLKVKEPG